MEFILLRIPTTGRLIIDIVALLMVGNPLPVMAGCVWGPEILAKARIVGCQGVMFEASPSSSRGKNKSGEDALIPYHKKGSKITGILLEVQIEESTLVSSSPAPHDPSGARPWPAGEWKTLFATGNADSLCPTILPALGYVVTGSECCDSFPAEDVCLVPGRIPVVKLEPKPEKWYKYERKVLGQ